jgi:hypothetical protein
MRKDKDMGYKQAREESKKMNTLKGLPFKAWWLLYVGVAIIALLSMFAGAYLGLAPNDRGEVFYVSTFDLITNVFFAIFYMVMFFVTAEAAFLFWLDKLILHDVDDKQNSVNVQVITAWAMLVVSLLTLVVTAVAAAEILAAWRHAFSGEAVFHEWAQGWIIEWIPALIIVHIIAATVYKQSTEEAKLERYRKTRMREARINALDKGTTAYVEEYDRIAPQAAEQAYREKARRDADNMRAELDIYAEEKRTGKDINKDGHIGQPQFTPRAVPMAAETEEPKGKIENFTGAGKQ